MNIGAARKRIILQSPVNTKTATGATTVTWKDEATVWAAIWSTASSEAVRSGQLNLDYTHRVRIRYRSDVKGSWRGSYDGKYYNIISMINPDMRNRTLDLICKETES